MARKSLMVWLFDDCIGTLALLNGRLNFSYSPEWLATPRAVPLSYALPLQTEPFSDDQARPFFAGLLPEGQLRRLIAQHFQVSGQNDFALLDHLGGECAGAVTFLPAGQALPEPAPQSNVSWLDDTALIEVLDRLPRQPMLAGSTELRLSLAGAQDKLPVIATDEQIGLPTPGMPSTHILKPPIHAVEDSVINEGFCLALAAAMNFKPARSQVRSVSGRKFLLVERYDRIYADTGAVQRLHQEDFCQALGTVPELKYQNEGGPALGHCFALLRAATHPSAPQTLRLLDYAVFNALIGNHDAHGKNFSLLYRGKTPVLAPLYDALCTTIYPTLTRKMAMKLGGKYKFSEVYDRHWLRFAEDAGLSPAQTRQRVLQQAKALPLAARALQNKTGAGFSGEPVVAQIVEVIEQRSALTIKRLSE